MPDEPFDSEQILQSASTVDSARLTLRWALERIHYLETSHHDILELLKKAQKSREEAVQELDTHRKSLDDRSQTLVKKERFVTELEGMLKNVFNGVVDVKELVRQRQDLDALKTQFETEAQQRIQEHEERHRKEIEEHARRLAALETSHAQALSDAQTRYQAEIKDIERQRQEESLIQSTKDSRFREDLVEQLQKQAEQYHQKLMLLQIDYAGRRQDLQKEYDHLKDKLLEESRHLESRQSFAVRVAQTRWQQERKKFEDDLHLRDEEIHKISDALDAQRKVHLDQEILKNRDHEEEQGRLVDAIGERHRQEIAALRDQALKDAETLQEQHRQGIAAMQQASRKLASEYENLLNGEMQERLRLVAELSRMQQQVLESPNSLKIEEQKLHIQELEKDLAQLRERRHTESEALLDENQRLTAELQQTRQHADATANRHRLEIEAVEVTAAGRDNQKIRELESKLAETREDYRKELDAQQEEARKDRDRLREENAALHRERLNIIDEQREVEEAKRRSDIGTRIRPSSPRRGYLLWATATAAAAVAAVCWTQHPLGRDYAVPFSHPSALVWEGDNLWVSDWHEQAVFRMRMGDSGLELIRRHSLPNTHVIALAVTQAHLYTIDSWTRQIQQRRRDDPLTVVASWPTPGPNPTALWFDGKYLWSSDRETHRLYQHALDASLAVLNTYPLAFSPVGGYADDQGFWSADGHSFYFHKHRLPPNMDILASYRLAELDEGRPPLSCFTWRGRSLWIGRDGMNRLMERPRWRLRQRAK